MKKVIVTGGLGFIGSNLIELLIKKKYFVINIDKITYSSNFYNTKEFKKSKNYKFIKCDINNKRFKKIIYKYKPIGIFNLAAETHVDRSIDNPENFIKSNIFGVYNILECFKNYSKKNKKTKLIHISTDEVYGDLKNNENIGTDQKDTLKVNYRRGDWGASLTALRVGELLDNGVKGDNGEIYLIPSMTTANLSVYKKFTLKGNDARLRLMVRNIADERAPLADGWFGFYSDIHRDDGRHYYLDLRMDFYNI